MAFKERLLSEVTADDLRAFCMRVKDRGAPATAVHLRDIVRQIYAYANLHEEKIENPADEVGVASIATFVPEDRVLSPLEIRLMHRQLEQLATYPTMLATLGRAEPTYELYLDLLKSARDDIARQCRVKALMEDEDQWPTCEPRLARSRRRQTCIG